MKKIFISILVLLSFVPFVGINTVRAANYIEAQEGIVCVKSQTKLYSKNDDGSFTETNGRLGAYYSWYSDQYAYDGSANEGYLRVATNEWVKSTDETYIFQSKNYHLTPQIDNYDNVNAKVVTVKYLDAPVYNDYGEKTSEVVPAYSSWKVDMHYSVSSAGLLDYHNYQRIAPNKWICMDDAQVTAIL
ncbi:hypothetical protein [Lactobacillus terrae]|uniref:hypothetical protein n=1 Tax=Lactobacillus terrae TaxID=2269374 RepID=UPI000C1B6D66|nr:hypothetical protein [Lactobacillus terrae]